jgi:RNAse (barnase) inhibitor barstar
MKNISFLKEPSTYFDERKFIGCLPEVEGEDELLKKLSGVFKFPNYFGNNWNAVFDCLCDFHWIVKKGIVLVHDEIPVLSVERLKVYLEILVDTIESWNDDNEHYFEVIFPEKSKQFINEILISLKKE